MALEVEKALLGMSNINELKFRDDPAGKHVAQITSLRAKLSSLLNEETVLASPLARLPDTKRHTYERFFELVYECSTNRVVAKALIDRILTRLD